MTFDECFQQLNETDEHPHLEAKAGSQMSDSLLETVCAFANEPGMGGGHILAGVARADDTLFPGGYRVVGVNNPDRFQSDIASRCATAFNRPVRPRIAVDTADGVCRVLVSVDEVQPAEKPIYFKNKGLPAGAFRRVGSTDQRCTDDDLLVFYQGRQAATYDEHVIADADLSAIDPEAVAVYRRRRQKANANAAELQWPDPELHEALCCATRADGILRPTAAGVLLFGTPQAVRRYFPMMRIDYIRVPGRVWVADPDRRFDTIELTGPLFHTLPRTFAAITDDLPKSFNLPAGQLNREDIPAVPSRVIREAVVNAIMHRTYRTHGPVQIIRYENRLEIRNPGHSLKAPEKFGDPGSQTRNPKIAAVLHDTDFAENKGSGIKVMRDKMEAANLLPPRLESDRVGDQFNVYLLFHHFVGQDAIDWLAHFPEANFTAEDARAMVWLREATVIDVADYRELNKGADASTASNRLRRLRDLGLLEMKGRSTATYYVPTDKLLAPLRGQSRASDPPPMAGATTGSPPGLPPGLDPLPPEFGTLPRESGSLPRELATEVASLGKRSGSEEVRRVIQLLCGWQAFQASELAVLLDRSQDYLLASYLGPMVRANELELTIPNAPTHPQQAYRAPAPRPSR